MSEAVEKGTGGRREHTEVFRISFSAIIKPEAGILFPRIVNVNEKCE